MKFVGDIQYAKNLLESKGNNNNVKKHISKIKLIVNNELVKDWRDETSIKLHNSFKLLKYLKNNGIDKSLSNEYYKDIENLIRLLKPELRIKYMEELVKREYGKNTLNGSNLFVDIAMMNKIKEFIALSEFSHLFSSVNDFTEEGYYLNEKGHIILNSDGFPDLSNNAREESYGKTVGGRYYYSLGPHWSSSNNSGWRQNNKKGVSTDKEFKYLLNNNRLMEFIVKKMNSNNKKYSGLIKIMKNDGHNFIQMLHKLVDTEDNEYYLRAFVLYCYIEHYIHHHGKLPKFQTSSGKNGTLLSPLYSAYYDIKNKEERKIKKNQIKKRKTTDGVKKQMKKKKQ